MNNLSKFPFFLILIMFTSSAFSKEIFLDCLLNFNIHEIDIDLDKRSGKWVPYTSKTFTENANDPQFRLSISSNKVRFGKRPSDYIEIDLITLKAKAVILTGLKDDSLGGGLEDDFSLGGGLEDDSLGGGLEDDSLGGGLEEDSLTAGFQDGICEKVPQRLSL
jgi:hypothetical protein